MFDIFGPAMAAMAFAVEQEKLFERSLEGLAPEEAQRRRERRQDMAAANARNARLCRAIEDSRPRGFGIFW